MNVDSLHLGQAHNVFSRNGFSGNKAKPNNRAYYRVVRECIKSLKKNGMCICFYEDQMEDIQNAVSFDTRIQFRNNDIVIRRNYER